MSGEITVSAYQRELTEERKRHCQRKDKKKGKLKELRVLTSTLGVAKWLKMRENSERINGDDTKELNSR